ncbi:GNAT family N-acetyltransferase [Shouchella clausii]|uniref:GNAT family N-acetyltransferase n=1 Tax=Shouchella clausii TaxID=79880 RepID=UPI000BA4E945|nr:GNAT family N-acetyltransferase [Shouchella clausii]PAF11150.1 GNAT family N-acetyltransferase [Shouchella clausii]
MTYWTKVAASEQEHSDCASVRHHVFIEEQGVSPSIERDQYDESATHIIMYDEKTPIGTGRVRLLAHNEAKIERVCVVKEKRRSGAGKQLMTALEEASARMGAKAAKLNAQTHASYFYEKLGYTVTSPEFIDAGIPHVTMSKPLTSKSGLIAD